MNQIIFLIQKGVDVHIFSLYPGNLEKLHSQYIIYGLENRLTSVANISKKLSQRLGEALIFMKRNGFWKNLAAFVKCMNPLNFGSSGLRLTYFIYYSRLQKISEYDLVHAHFGQMGAFFARFVSLGFFEKTPYLVSFHGFDLVPNENGENKILYRQMFGSAKIFTVNSQYTGKLLEKVDSSLNSRVRLLPESLDSSLFGHSEIKKNQTQDKSYKLVFVGRLVDWKGADTAIEIVDKVVHQFDIDNVELSIIGNGPLRAKLENMIADRGLSDKVKLMGAQDQSIIRSILSQSDLFLYTGREQVGTQRAENQGLVLMEAQAMGLPVVAFNVGGVGEGIIDKETGILVHSDDVNSFAWEVVNLLHDKQRRFKMGELAIEFIKKKYDLPVLGNRLLDIYEEVLS